MSTVTTVILVVIVLHLLLGFGWLIYKLSPRERDPSDQKEQPEQPE